MKHNEQNCRVQGSQSPFKQYSQYNNIHYHEMNDTTKPKTNTGRISHRQFISAIQFELAIVYGWRQKVRSNTL